MKRLLFAFTAAASVLAGFATASAAPSLAVVQRIAGPDGGWDYASFDAARGRVYVAHGTQVLSLDVKTGVLNANFAQGDRLHAVVPVPGSDVLVTTNSGDKTVKILNAADGSLLKSLSVDPDADGAVFDPATGDVIVVNGDAGIVTLVDPKAMSVVATIKVGDALEFPAVDGKGRAFVNVESTGEIAVIDLGKRQVLGRYAMADCKRPTGLAYVVGDRLVSSCGSGVAKILDASSGKEIASLKIGGFPDAVLYDPNRALALIPTALDGQLNVIALSGAGDNTIVATIPTQIGTRTGAVDPSTGRVYLPTAEYVLPVPAGQRPTTKPGTFQILIMDRQ
jgi:DNA-binding beta-propeller fold protein YncE